MSALETKTEKPTLATLHNETAGWVSFAANFELPVEVDDGDDAKQATTCHFMLGQDEVTFTYVPANEISLLETQLTALEEIRQKHIKSGMGGPDRADKIPDEDLSQFLEAKKTILGAFGSFWEARQLSQLIESNPSKPTDNDYMDFGGLKTVAAKKLSECANTYTSKKAMIGLLKSSLMEMWRLEKSKPETGLKSKSSFLGMLGLEKLKSENKPNLQENVTMSEIDADLDTLRPIEGGIAAMEDEISRVAKCAEKFFQLHSHYEPAIWKKEESDKKAQQEKLLKAALDKATKQKGETKENPSQKLTPTVVSPGGNASGFFPLSPSELKEEKAMWDETTIEQNLRKFAPHIATDPKFTRRTTQVFAELNKLLTTRAEVITSTRSRQVNLPGAKSKPEDVQRATRESQLLASAISSIQQAITTADPQKGIAPVKEVICAQIRTLLKRDNPTENIRTFGAKEEPGAIDFLTRYESKKGNTKQGPKCLARVHVLGALGF